MKLIRLIRHDESFEVRYGDGKPSRYFYFDDDPSRRAVTGRVTHETAEEVAKEFARAERDGRYLARGEYAEKSAITINLCGFARGCSARLQWRIALVNSPLPQRWLQFNHRDFEQAWLGLLGHPTNMQCG
jgi:hypothetical protein